MTADATGKQTGTTPMTGAQPAESSASDAADNAATSEPSDDKRRNLALRLLVDEMMSQIREVARKDLWTEEERQAYERDLDRIMGRVRDEAMRTSKD